MLHDRHRRLIAVTLEAAAPYGAALGGRNALVVHGLTKDTTKVIDLVTSRQIGAKGARDVEKALKRDGNQIERMRSGPEMEQFWHGGQRGSFQWTVRKPEPHDHPPIGGMTKYACHKCWERDLLGVNRAPRSRDPVETSLGPVVHPEDAAGAKISDLARRGDARDYRTAGDLMDRYKPDELITFARRVDPTLRDRDVVGLAHRLDKAPELAFTWHGRMDSRGVSELRDRFADWPRDLRDVRRTDRGDTREHPDHDRNRSERPESGQERIEPQPVRAVPVRDLTAAARTAPDSPLARQAGNGTRQSIHPRARQRELSRDEPEIGR